jgi:hypothetical protein
VLILWGEIALLVVHVATQVDKVGQHVLARQIVQLLLQRHRERVVARQKHVQLKAVPASQSPTHPQQICIRQQQQ